MEGFKKKNILILQPFGLGDNIFTVTIARHYARLGHKVIYPVYGGHLDGLIKAYPDIGFVPESGYEKYQGVKKYCEIDGYSIIPIRHTVEIMRKGYDEVMTSKYDFLSMDYKKWHANAQYKRDHEREKRLAEFLGWYPGMKYNLINRYFGTGSTHHSDHDMHLDNGNEKIFVERVHGYSLFDYSFLIECASEIHVVNSSILYLLELLRPKCPIHLYSRKPVELDFRTTQKIHTLENIKLHY